MLPLDDKTMLVDSYQGMHYASRDALKIKEVE